MTSLFTDMFSPIIHVGDGQFWYNETEILLILDGCHDSELVICITELYVIALVGVVLVFIPIRLLTRFVNDRSVDSSVTMLKFKPESNKWETMKCSVKFTEAHSGKISTDRPKIVVSACEIDFTFSLTFARRSLKLSSMLTAMPSSILCASSKFCYVLLQHSLHSPNNSSIRLFRISLDRRSSWACKELTFLPVVKSSSPCAIRCGEGDFAVSVCSRGDVYTIGNGSRGELGSGRPNEFTEFTLIDLLGGLPISDVQCGLWHSVALSRSGDVYVWGWNKSGQLGFNPDEFPTAFEPTLADIPEHIEGKIVQVACGHRHSVILTKSGEIFACGFNNMQQVCSDDTNDFIYEWVKYDQVEPNKQIKNIYCGMWSTSVHYFDDNK